MSEIEDLYDDPVRYDLFEGEFVTGSFLEFYKRQAERHGEPILELACGSGRILIPLSEAGFHITGLDINPRMLDWARKKASRLSLELDLIEGDMTNFDLDRKFPFIFAAAQCFSHLYDTESLEKCLECVKRHLTENGRFLIELLNPAFEYFTRDPDKIYDESSTMGKIKMGSKMFYDKATQINHIQLLFPDGNAKKILSLKMRQFFPQEIDTLLKYNGFIVEEKYGDWDENPFSSESRKQLLICRKI